MSIDIEAAFAIAQAAQTRAAAASAELSALCAGPYRDGGRHFTMSIPRRDDDSDEVLGATIDDVPALAALVVALASRVRELETAGNALEFEAHEVAASWGEGHVSAMTPALALTCADDAE